MIKKKRKYLFLFLFLLSSVIAFTLYLTHVEEVRTQSAEYLLSELVLQVHGTTPLPASYVASLLFKNKERNLYRLDLSEMERELLHSPYIQQTHLTRLPPKQLLVEVTTRDPIAVFGNVAHCVIDRTGVLMPDIFAGELCERLPKIWVRPSSHYTFGKQIEEEHWDEIVWHLDRLTTSFRHFQLTWADFSNAFSEKMSQQQIVLRFTAEGREWLVRFRKKFFLNRFRQIASFLLRSTLDQSTCWVDCREENIVLFHTTPYNTDFP